MVMRMRLMMVSWGKNNAYILFMGELNHFELKKAFHLKTRMCQCSFYFEHYSCKIQRIVHIAAGGRSHYSVDSDWPCMAASAAGICANILVLE